MVDKIKRNIVEDDAVTQPKIAAGAVDNTALNKTAITGLSELTTVADNDKLIISDTSAGTLKQVNKSRTTGLDFPTISSISPDNVQTVDGGDITFTITGTGFTTGTNARLISNTGARLNFSSVTRTSTTSITATVARSSFLLAQSPYDIQVINGEGLSVVSQNQIDVDNTPIFVTSAGSLGSFVEGSSIDITVEARDPDSSSAVTFELQSGSLPAGLSLVNQSGDSCRITGTATAVSADTTSNFTLRAFDSASNTVSRNFSITITDFSLNSARFDDGSSDHLKQTFSGAGNQRTFTISFWFKRGNLSNGNIYTYQGEGNEIRSEFILYDNYLKIVFNPTGSAWSSDMIIQGSGTSDNYLFRDPSAWYHVVLAIDTTQSTEADRIKPYVNGELQKMSAYPSLNFDTGYNTAIEHAIGTYIHATNTFFDGYFSEFHVVDGQQLAATSFGETDSNGVWIPKNYTGSYGTNGFHLDFADASDLGDDESGNGNDFTEVNLTSIDKAEDSPQNNYITMNPIASQGGSTAGPSGVTFENGNLDVGNITSETAIANIGVDTGKWYWEVKVLTDQDGLTIGACNQHFHLDAELGYNSPSSISAAKIFGYYGGNGNKATTVGDGTQFSSYGDAIAVNDIIGIAMNLDDNEVTFYKNGTAQNSGTAISITALGDGEQYFPAVGNWSASTIKCAFNFGNPTFSISSSNTDANGYGNFEYAVPSGYYALNTKNLAQYG